MSLSVNSGADSSVQPSGSLRVSQGQILERLLVDLQKSRQQPKQIRCILETLREALPADVAFWFTPNNPDGPTVVGDQRFSPQGCEQFALRLLGMTRGSESHLLWHKPAATPDEPGVPQSALLVRVNKAEGSWLIAVSLDPQRRFRPPDLELLSLVRRIAITQHQHQQLFAQFRDSVVGMIRGLTATIDARDGCTAGHSERVARIGMVLAKHMNLPTKTASDVFLAGLVHDIGKVGVSDKVLMKPGRLTDDEFAEIQEHVIIGERILSGMEQLAYLCPAVRSHHEHFDGAGYPDGLTGQNIPFIARVLAVADSCDAMMSSRRYRGPLSPPRIDTLFLQGSGRQWDPEIVEHFMACRPQIYPPIYQKGLGDSATHAVDQVLSEVAEGSSMTLTAYQELSEES